MKKVVVSGLLISALSGSSSIVSKSEYAVAFASVPEAATFTITDAEGQQVHAGVTPATVTLKSSAG